jgi:rhodanese-related sulfurtransferase
MDGTMLNGIDNALGTGPLAKAAMVAALAAVLLMAMRLIGGGVAFAGEVMSAAEAHAKAMGGEITLVDVRTPDEWKQTGVPASAHTITMHQPGAQLIKQLDEALGGDRTKPLAIICRTGNRTGSLAGPLEKAGYSKIIDVSEGVAGSRAGQGWFKSGLPVRKWAPGETAPVQVTQQR